MNTPNLAHWREVLPHHQMIIDFLEFLESGNALPNGGIIRLEIEDRPGHPEKLQDAAPHVLADRYLQVDRAALEAEALAVIRASREACAS